MGAKKPNQYTTPATEIVQVRRVLIIENYLMEVGLLGFEEFHTLVKGLLTEGSRLTRQLEGQRMLEEHRKHLHRIRGCFSKEEQYALIYHGRWCPRIGSIARSSMYNISRHGLSRILDLSLFILYVYIYMYIYIYIYMYIILLKTPEPAFPRDGWSSSRLLLESVQTKIGRYEHKRDSYVCTHASQKSHRLLRKRVHNY